MKASDYIAKFLKEKNVDLLFAITGSGSVRLIESASNAGITYVCPHHEQAGIMASLVRTRVSGHPAVMMVTGGPGASNTIIGLADAHLDSIPMIVIAGQENLNYVYPLNQMRGKGVQGLDMCDIVKTITKYQRVLTKASDIRKILEEAFYEMYTGRPGPVWVDIPQNMQWEEVDENNLEGFVFPKSTKKDFSLQARQTLELLRQSSRPLLWIGHGIRLSNSEEKLQRLLKLLDVPCLVTWQAADLVPDSNSLFAGRAGTYGQRFGNLALQNSDLLITLGTRLALPQRGFNDTTFARAAKKVICEIDPVEMDKFTFMIDVPVLGDVSDFIDALIAELESNPVVTDLQPWKDKITHWQNKYPMATKPVDETATGVNSYWFIERLSALLPDNALIVTDMGTSLTCTHAGIKLKEGQRIVTSTGLGEMGFGLPGAIGAALGNTDRPIILIAGEGSFMMNLQELQTLKHLKLNIKIFLLNNNGYLTIKHTHNALYESKGQASATDHNTGVSFPDFSKIAYAFDIQHTSHTTAQGLDDWISSVLNSDETVFAELAMPAFQELIPKMSLKKREDGTVYTNPLEDMYPFLSEEELASEMIVPMLKNN